MMKLGLFLFLQLKDGTLTSRTPAPCRTSQALCVWPLRTRRGRSHHSSCSDSGGGESAAGAQGHHHRHHPAATAPWLPRSPRRLPSALKILWAV